MSKLTIENINKQLKELELDPIETRPYIIVYNLIVDVGFDIGNEHWGTFESYEEAKELIERSRTRHHGYEIEEEKLYISPETIEKLYENL